MMDLVQKAHYSSRKGRRKYKLSQLINEKTVVSSTVSREAASNLYTLHYEFTAQGSMR